MTAGSGDGAVKGMTNPCLPCLPGTNVDVAVGARPNFEFDAAAMSGANYKYGVTAAVRFHASNKRHAGLRWIR